MPLLTEEDIRALADKPVLTEFNTTDFHNPPKEYQEGFTGVSFHLAYSEAASFLNHIFAKIEADSGKLDFKKMRIVDFGSGWGRMLRLLRTRPELNETELYGCEQYLGALNLCQKTLPRVWLSRTYSYPPCDLRSGFIDIIYAYSVFSHLNAEPHMAWAQEFHRLLRPGGYACVTVQPRDFITICKEYRDGTRPRKNDWHERLAGAFKDDAECFRRYDAGELVFEYSTGGANMDPEVYGDAVVPKSFFEKHWARLGFTLIDWDPVPAHFGAQPRAILRKNR